MVRYVYDHNELNVSAWWEHEDESKAVHIKVDSGNFVPPAASKALEFTPEQIVSKDVDEYLASCASYRLQLYCA